MKRETPPEGAERTWETLRTAGLLAKKITREETLRLPLEPPTAQVDILGAWFALPQQERGHVLRAEETLPVDPDYAPTAINRLPPEPDGGTPDGGGPDGGTPDEPLDPPTALNPLPAEPTEEYDPDEEPATALSPLPPEPAVGTPAVGTPAVGTPAGGTPEEPLDPPTALNPLPAEPAEIIPKAMLSMIPIQQFSEYNPEGEESVELLLRRPIGEGGTSAVHLAMQCSLRRDVAIKYVREGKRSKEMMSMLLHEGVLMGHLEHPNIIPVHQLGIDEDQLPVLVMKYVEGVSWAELLEEDDHPYWSKLQLWSNEPLMRHLEILLEICKAVEFAHSRGVIHLDIKPENVMLGEFGQVYLLDWGIARQVAPEPTGQPAPEASRKRATLPPFHPTGFAGTPMYMAPEMLKDQKLLGVRTDIYLLGGTLYQILTGRPPHDGATLLDAFVSAFRPLDFEGCEGIPSQLLEICKKATSVSQSRRHPNVASFRTELLDYLRYRASNKCCESAAERLGELKRIREAMGAEASSPQRQQLLQVFAECRFGYRQSLQIWAGNKDAWMGLMDAIELMFEVECQRGDADAAANLLEEINPPPERLVQTLAALRQRLADEEREQARLKQLQRDLDASVAQKERVRLMLKMGAFACFFALTRFLIGPATSAATGHYRSLFYVALTFALLLGFLYIERDTLLQNDINRRFSALMVFACVSILFHRLARLWLQHPVPLTYGFDLMILAWIFLTAGIILRRWLLWNGLLLLVGGLLALRFPAVALYILSICVAVGWLLCAYFWVREEAEKQLAEA